jgi:hypothetical protein
MIPMMMIIKIGLGGTFIGSNGIVINLTFLRFQAKYLTSVINPSTWYEKEN